MHLFGEKDVHEYDILAIQEPYINKRTDPLTTYALALQNRFHILLQPTPQKDYVIRPRVCLYVNKRIDPTTWEVRFHNRDLITLILYTTDHTIHIHNIYNPGVARGQESAIRTLRDIMTPGAQHIVLGDFNLHHPLWAGSQYPHVDDEATELIDLMDEHEIEQLLPRGTTTYERKDAKTTIDLIWASNALSNRLISCVDKREWWYGADHVPVLTQFDLTPVRVPPIIRKDWGSSDWELFLKLIETYDWHPRELANTEDIDKAVRYLVDAIHDTAEQATPTRRITPYSRAGYTPEMAELKHQVTRCRRHARRVNSDRAWEEYTEAKKELKRRTNQLARDLHRQRIEEATESLDGFWKIARWVRNRGTPRASFTPTLTYNDTDYAAPKEKAALLREVLYPEPPEADLADISRFTYPKPYETPPITLDEVRIAVHSVKPHKAPGPDEIPNLVLQRLLPVIEHYLVNLFNACIRCRYHPEHFRRSTTVVIRKPGKSDYTDPKSYRPIALLSTIGKTLESIMARRLSYLVEKHNLLPKYHIGGRRGRSCELAIHLLLEETHNAWRDGSRVATGLAMDVTGAFDNVNHTRLIHDLRKRQVPEELVGWIASFLRGRRTSIVLLEGNMGEYPVETGIPQGSPLSPILFLFFNADLIEQIRAECPEVLVIGYIDDILLMAFGSSATANCRTLTHAHQVAERWERTHASKFNPAKYQLTHFWRKHQSVPKPRGRLDVPLLVKGREVIAKDSIKYLGVLLDTHLTGETHVREMRKKAARLVAGLSSIAGSTWGTPLTSLRKIYTAVLQPQIMYACSMWYIRGGRGFMKAQREAEKAIQSIHAQALHRISGAFRRTSRQALEVCLYIPPSELTLARLAEEACLRLMTSPLRSTLHSTRNHAHRNDPFTSPLHRLEFAIERKLGRGVCQRIETIHPFVVPPWWDTPDMKIDDTREDAIHAQTTTTSKDIQFFTDGSGFDNGIGAAAYSPTFGYAARAIGSSETHTVYAGELEGIDAALSLIIRNQNHSDTREATIYTDNQAAIRATCHPQRSSGQYILRRIVRQLDLLRDPRSHWRLRFQWVPGHEGIPGNEEADRLAKCAAVDATQRTQETGRRARINAPNQATPHAARISYNPYHSVILVAVCRQRLRAEFAKRWKEQWDGAAHGRHLYRIVSTPAKTVVSQHEGLSRAWSSALIQLLTGKSALRSFLASVGIEDSPTCPCGLGDQTTAHVLVQCPLHADLRMKTLYQEAREIDDRRLLTESLWVRKSIEFVLRTGLLTQFRNAIPIVQRSQ